MLDQVNTGLHGWQGIIMGPCKTKPIQADLGIWHNLVCSSCLAINQVYSETWVILACSEPWHIQKPEPKAYSEFCYIQNCGIFRTRGIFRTSAKDLKWSILQTLLTARNTFALLKEQFAPLKYRCHCAVLKCQCVALKNQHFSDIYQWILLKGQCAHLAYCWALLK